MNANTRSIVAPLALFAALAIPAAFAVAHPTPWSPMGQANKYGQVADKSNYVPKSELGQLVIPKGWGPAEVAPDGQAPEQAPAVPVDPSIQGV